MLVTDILVRRYSDDGKSVRKRGTEEVYGEAVDLALDLPEEARAAVLAAVPEYDETEETTGTEEA